MYDLLLQTIRTETVKNIDNIMNTLSSISDYQLRYQYITEQQQQLNLYTDLLTNLEKLTT